MRRVNGCYRTSILAGRSAAPALYDRSAKSALENNSPRRSSAHVLAGCSRTSTPTRAMGQSVRSRPHRPSRSRLPPPAPLYLDAQPPRRLWSLTAPNRSSHSTSCRPVVVRAVPLSCSPGRSGVVLTPALQQLPRAGLGRWPRGHRQQVLSRQLLTRTASHRILKPILRSRRKMTVRYHPTTTPQRRLTLLPNLE